MSAPDSPVLEHGDHSMQSVHDSNSSVNSLKSSASPIARASRNVPFDDNEDMESDRLSHSDSKVSSSNGSVPASGIGGHVAPRVACLYRLSAHPSFELPLHVILDPARNRRVVFGRQRDKVDIVLDSYVQQNLISREHAVIEYFDERGWVIKDLNSVNGLFVNDVKISKTVMHEGDRVIFGGGGNLKMGARRTQRNSEFEYKFSYSLPAHARRGGGQAVSASPRLSSSSATPSRNQSVKRARSHESDDG